MPFLFRATPRQDLAGWSLRSEANLTAAGHSRDTPDQTPDATEHRPVVAHHPPSGHYGDLTFVRRWWPAFAFLAGALVVQTIVLRDYDVSGHAAGHLGSAQAVFVGSGLIAIILWPTPSAT